MTVSLSHHNLPSQRNAFLGRETEVQQIGSLLRQPETRLLTLTGSGGTGKTRLSLAVGDALLEDYADGIFFVPLAALTDSDFVLPAIADVLEVSESGGIPLGQTLAETLHAKRLLLILDNFEHVIDAAAQVAALLKAAPHLQILVSSRQSLHIADEQEFAVSPLPVPDIANPLSLDELAANPAVGIFLQHAQFVQPTFALTAENAAPIADICARLDGLPLAIELAAARVRQFPPAALLTRLDDSLGVLTQGGRDRDARQQTLRGLIGWSYELLSVGEQAIFGRLGVFAGGCTEAAATAVCSINDDLPLTIEEGLAALVDKNLVQQSTVDDETRYSLLQTIREYALYTLERLAPTGEEATIIHQHGQYFLALAEQAETELVGAQQVTWMLRLEREHDNIRAALRSALDQTDVEFAGRLGSALWRFWGRRGYFSEGRKWMEAALTQPERISPAVRAKALYALGAMVQSQGDYALSVAYEEESLRLYRELGDKSGIAMVAGDLGAVAREQGDYDRANLYNTESLALQRELANTRGIATVLNNMGGVALEQGEYARAEALFEESLALVEELGDQWSAIIILENLGVSLLNQGDYVGAQTMFERCLAQHRDLEATLGLSSSLINLADVVRLFDPDRARSLYEEGLALALELGDERIVAFARIGLGQLSQMQGQYAEARAFLTQSLAYFRTSTQKNSLMVCLETLGITWALERNAVVAVRLLGAATAARAALRVMRPTGEQGVYDNAVALTHTQLDMTAWDVLWNEGQSMTLEDAAEYALAQSEGKTDESV